MPATATAAAIAGRTLLQALTTQPAAPSGFTQLPTTSHPQDACMWLLGCAAQMP